MASSSPPRHWFHRLTRSVHKSTTKQEMERLATDTTTKVYVTALDEVVSVNSFFTAAVFIGLSLNVSQSLVSSGENDPCNAGRGVARILVVYEVLSFSCYLFSSLVAQGLKLQMSLLHLKNGSKGFVRVNRKVLRFGMLASIFGSLGGKVFLLLSMVNVVQLKLGLLSCNNVWAKRAAIPLIILFSTGVSLFISPVLYAVLK